MNLILYGLDLQAKKSLNLIKQVLELQGQINYQMLPKNILILIMIEIIIFLLFGFL